MKTLAIVGASLAGLSAGRAARAQGFTGRLVIIGDEPHRPYDRPALSKEYLLGTVAAEDLSLESDADELGSEFPPQQDFDACERCQPAMGSKIYAKGGVLVPSEHHIGAFHDWVQEMIGDVTPAG